MNYSLRIPLFRYDRGMAKTRNSKIIGDIKRFSLGLKCEQSMRLKMHSVGKDGASTFASNRAVTTTNLIHTSIKCSHVLCILNEFQLSTFDIHS